VFEPNSRRTLLPFSLFGKHDVSIRYIERQASFRLVRQIDDVREYRHRSSALPASQFSELKDALLSSALVGRSTLAGPFQSSRGFAVIFRGRGRVKVEERFPTLKPWLDLTLGAPAVRALTPWWRRAIERVPNPRYLNVLLVSQGGTVSRHVDATLRKPAQVDDAIPELVSVLYLSVPRSKGGELQLWNGAEALARLKPAENDSIHFRGDLAHEVCAFEAGPDTLRASLVIEQYHFADDVVARLPDFKLESRAGFSAYLDHHQTSGAPKTFELEND
jgi:hypothetical protein